VWYRCLLREMHGKRWLKRRHRLSDGWTLIEARFAPVYWFGVLPTALFNWFLKRHISDLGQWWYV